MGQINQKPQASELPTIEAVTLSIQRLFGGDHANFYPELINPYLVDISRMMSEMGLYSQTPEGFKVNEHLLACIYHQNFEEVIRRIFDLLVDELRQISQAKIMIMVQRERFRKCLNMANYCLFFTDQTNLQTIGLLSVRSDLHPETKQKVNSFTREGRELAQPFQGFSLDQKSQFCRLLRVCMSCMLELHMKLISRSDFTLEIIDQLNRTCWMLYTKLYFQTSEVIRRENSANGKVITKLAAYFVGVGIDRKISAIYQAGVLILLNIARGKGLQEAKALPSHLFKTLPIVTNNEMLQWVCCVLLFSLQYAPKNGRLYCRLNSNRVPAFQLLEHLFKEFKPYSPQLTYLLEELCLQTRPTQIERIYVSSIASYYIESEVDSAIIRKYSETKQVNFNLKSMNRRIKVRPQDVMTQLEGDEEAAKKEINGLCNKYVLQAILRSGLMYDYSDKALWSEIIGQLDSIQEEDFRQSEQQGRKEMRAEEDVSYEYQRQKEKQFIRPAREVEKKEEYIQQSSQAVETEQVKIEAKSSKKVEVIEAPQKQTELPKHQRYTQSQEVEMQPIQSVEKEVGEEDLEDTEKQAGPSAASNKTDDKEEMAERQKEDEKQWVQDIVDDEHEAA